MRFDYNRYAPVFQSVPQGDTVVKCPHSYSIAQVICVLLVTAVFPTSTIKATQHRFVFEEYEQFHDVLHPLEHEALPQKDYRRIRNHAKELVRLGNAILKLGVPQISRVPEEMEKELKEFRKALSRFDRDANVGSNARLHKSYSVVHDSFEKLARLSEEVNRGVPPVVSLNCPEAVNEGDRVTLKVFFPTPIHDVTWTVSAGKMIHGDKKTSIILDTSGLAGATVSVTAEVDDGMQQLLSTACAIKVSVRK